MGLGDRRRTERYGDPKTDRTSVHFLSIRVNLSHVCREDVLVDPLISGRNIETKSVFVRG
jgi:hypothetical protein